MGVIVLAESKASYDISIVDGRHSPGHGNGDTSDYRYRTKEVTWPT